MFGLGLVWLVVHWRIHDISNHLFHTTWIMHFQPATGEAKSLRIFNLRFVHTFLYTFFIFAPSSSKIIIYFCSKIPTLSIYSRCIIPQLPVAGVCWAAGRTCQAHWCWVCGEEIIGGRKGWWVDNEKTSWRLPFVGTKAG